MFKKEKERDNIQKEVSKLDQLIDSDTQILNSQIKEYMDMIKIIARNIFYLTFDKFRKDYDNYRDDLLIFRSITRSNGIIQNEDSRIVFKLTPEMELTPKMVKSIQKIIDDINKLQPVTIDGVKNKLFLRIEQNNESLFAFSFC